MAITRDGVKHNVRLDGDEQQLLQDLLDRMKHQRDSGRYLLKRWPVGISSILVWGLHALKRELDAAQAAAKTAAAAKAKPARAGAPGRSRGKISSR